METNPQRLLPSGSPWLFTRCQHSTAALSMTSGVQVLLAEAGGGSVQCGVDQVQVGGPSNRRRIGSEDLGGEMDPLIEREVDGRFASHVSASRSRISRCSAIVAVTVSANSSSTGATWASVSAASSSTLTPRAAAAAWRRRITSSGRSTISDMGSF